MNTGSNMVRMRMTAIATTASQDRPVASCKPFKSSSALYVLTQEPAWIMGHVAASIDPVPATSTMRSTAVTSSTGSTSAGTSAAFRLQKLRLRLGTNATAALAGNAKACEALGNTCERELGWRAAERAEKVRLLDASEGAAVLKPAFRDHESS